MIKKLESRINEHELIIDTMHIYWCVARTFYIIDAPKCNQTMSELDASAARNGELDVLNVSIKQLSDAAMAESVITRFTAGARFELKISGHHQTKYIYIYMLEDDGCGQMHVRP